jgi:DNA-binding CsgD family transcriptional regulator
MTVQETIAGVSIKDALSSVSDQLYDEETLAVAESAIDRVAELLMMPWPWWTPDASHPYMCRHAEQFAVNRGWPVELINLWQSRNITLCTPFHIRARFEHLPFVTAPDLRTDQSRPPGYVRANEMAREMGIATMLHVPVHLPKGRVALVNWAGSLDADYVRRILPSVSAELLMISHLFMRIYAEWVGHNAAASEERSQLTLREWDCLRTIAQGYREEEAAGLLRISKSTVRFHIENVVRKFGCKNRTHAVALASQLGLLGPIGP